MSYLLSLNVRKALRHSLVFVIPAKAGIQFARMVLDPGLRRDDGSRWFCVDSTGLFRAMQVCTSVLVIIAFAILTSGCSALLPKATPPPSVYVLSGTPVIEGAPASVVSQLSPTLVVNPPRAAAGFDSRRMLYVREAHKLEYFAHSEWIDTPARMLAPLIADALGHAGAFRAVVLTPSAAAHDMSLDVEVLRLQQEFGDVSGGVSSQAHLTLRVTLVDSVTRKVLAWRELDASVNAATDDPYGGVLASNAALGVVLTQLSRFCSEAVAVWQMSTSASFSGKK